LQVDAAVFRQAFGEPLHLASRIGLPLGPAISSPLDAAQPETAKADSNKTMFLM